MGAQLSLWMGLLGWEIASSSPLGVGLRSAAVLLFEGVK